MLDSAERADLPPPPGLQTGPSELPHALRVWDNRARLSMPWMLTLWLAFLVATFLCSVLFVEEHQPARWALGGFVASHLLVLVLSLAKEFTLRKGTVSLIHVVFWTPGFALAVLDGWRGTFSTDYEIWLYTLMAVISVSFVFDLRDAGRYLRCLVRGEIPSSRDREPAKERGQAPY